MTNNAPQNPIPQSYEEWVHCITVKCGLELTPEYIEKRISALQNMADFKTKQYIDTYGNQYHQLVLSWFIQARQAQS